MSVVMITGCSSGFGRLAAVEFARQGHTVFATMRDPAKASGLLEDAAAERLDLQVVPLDVLDPASVEAGVAGIIDREGRIDVCVNNAGIEVKGPIEECDDDEVRLQFDTNVFGLLRVVRAVVPSMRAQGAGVIINVGSVAGLVGRPFGGLYAASKHAVEAISEAMHYELSPFGIRVAVVEPGQFETDLFANAIEAKRFTADSPYRAASDRFDTALRRLVPDGKPAPAEVVADAIVHIAGDDRAGLRHVLGTDAELIVSVRNAGDFEQFEKTMRSALDWWD